MNLPNDFNQKARLAAANCPFVLDTAATGCPLVPGTVVLGRNNDIEDVFPKGRTIRLVLFGFSRPHAYACCLDRDGDWWNVHPESLSLEAP